MDITSADAQAIYLWVIEIVYVSAPGTIPVEGGLERLADVSALVVDKVQEPVLLPLDLALHLTILLVHDSFDKSVLELSHQSKKYHEQLRKGQRSKRHATTRLHAD